MLHGRAEAHIWSLYCRHFQIENAPPASSGYVEYALGLCACFCAMSTPARATSRALKGQNMKQARASQGAHACSTIDLLQSFGARSGSISFATMHFVRTLVFPREGCGE